MSHTAFKAMPPGEQKHIARKSDANMILNAVRAPVLLLNGEDTVIGANEAAYAIWARPAADIVGQAAASLISVRGASLTKSPFSIEAGECIADVTAAGQTRVYSMLVTLSVDKGGARLNKIVVLHDITGMQKALSQAKRASRAKRDYLSHMSHEIRTPLNAIVGMLHIMQKSLAAGDGHKLAASVESAVTASRHLLGVVNDVLDLSKIEAGKFELACEPFALVPALQEVTSIIAQRCHDNDLRFEQDIAALPELWLLGDKTRLAQVLINILGNSVKFTQPGGTVRMEARARPGPGAVKLCFVLTDNGAGMPPEFLSRLFDPFERADNAATRRAEGTGLGLAICRSLVRMMGGDIQVESEEGRGTRFEFTAELAVAAEGPEESLQACDKYDFSGKRLLLVDDIDVNRLILRELLADTGAAIEEARDGLEAVEKFAAAPPQHYDLILMDIKMPRMDGCEAAQSIRALAHPDAAGIPIVAMSADAFRSDVENALNSGMNAHLAKPVDLEKSLNTLSRYLCARQAAPVQG